MASSSPAIDGLLANHEVIRTEKVERMSATLYDVYKGRIVSVDTCKQPFFGQARRVQFEHIGLDYCAYDAEVEIDFPNAPSLRQQFCLDGAGETLLRRAAVPLSGRSTCVIPSGAAITTRFGAGYRQLVLRVDPAALLRRLESFVGANLPGPIEFRSAQTFHSPQLATLKRSALFFASEVDGFERDASRLARGEFQEALLAAFLTGNAHNYSYLLQAPPPALTPRQVWLAEAWIEANWDKPLTVETLSGAVGYSARSIFKAFKDYRGYSPMEFAKKVRLRRARDMLSRPRPGDTVTEVAFRCGFQNHGHFAREYRSQFGESPSKTITRAKRARLG